MVSSIGSKVVRLVNAQDRRSGLLNVFYDLTGKNARDWKKLLTEVNAELKAKSGNTNLPVLHASSGILQGLKTKLEGLQKRIKNGEVTLDRLQQGGPGFRPGMFQQDIDAVRKRTEKLKTSYAELVDEFTRASGAEAAFNDVFDTWFANVARDQYRQAVHDRRATRLFTGATLGVLPATAYLTYKYEQTLPWPQRTVNRLHRKYLRWKYNLPKLNPWEM